MGGAVAGIRAVECRRSTTIATGGNALVLVHARILVPRAERAAKRDPESTHAAAANRLAPPRQAVTAAPWVAAEHQVGILVFAKEPPRWLRPLGN